MTIPRTIPTPRNDDINDPQEVNDILGYAADLLDEATELRYIKSVLPMEFLSVTEASNVAERTMRIIAPGYVSVEQIHADVDNTGDEIGLYIFLSGTSSVPSGVTNPIWRSNGNAVVTDRFFLEQEQEYDLIVKALDASGTFTASGVFSFHVSSDRWFVAGVESVPTYVPNVFADGDAFSTANLEDEADALATEVAALSDVCFAAIVATVKGFDSASNINYRKVRLPKFDPARAVGTAALLHLYVVMDGTGGNEVSVETDFRAIPDGHGVIAAVAGVRSASGYTTTTGGDDSLDGSAGDTVQQANDGWLLFECDTAGAGGTVLRATATLWVTR